MELTMDHQKKQRKFRLETGISILYYVVVNMFLVFVNWLTSPNYWWVLWVIGSWGIGLALKLISEYARYRSDIDN